MLVIGEVVRMDRQARRLVQMHATRRSRRRREKEVAREQAAIVRGWFDDGGRPGQQVKVRSRWSGLKPSLSIPPSEAARQQPPQKLQLQLQPALKINFSPRIKNQSSNDHTAEWRWRWEWWGGWRRQNPGKSLDWGFAVSLSLSLGVSLSSLTLGSSLPPFSLSLLSQILALSPLGSSSFSGSLFFVSSLSLLNRFLLLPSLYPS